jgi:[acyl-carrier-protein] S-malonyltransferase
MKPAEERLAPELRALRARTPKIPVIANVDAEAKTDGASSIDALVRQISAPVRWDDVMRRMVADGVKAFVEVGPGAVLSGLAKKAARDATVLKFESPEDLPAVEELFRQS